LNGVREIARIITSAQKEKAAPGIAQVTWFDRMKQL
jgi:hypothetical protein